MLTAIINLFRPWLFRFWLQRSPFFLERMKLIKKKEKLMMTVIRRYKC